MDPRVDMLDKRMDRIDAKLDGMDGRLRGIELTLAKMPTVNGLWGMIATVLGIALAIAGLTFMVAEWVKG
jgi:hypothetical protein